ncbi:hypothetical protein M4951_04635 [Blastopirellula sp. J2-11]|uniref:hypothetical protein n=1 Tax=Blastopirellula sp. J2-11 TaxID=2943192 RepID=UPI0021C56B1C|nr:hypothetical protein [Blastopirellula sp. J2-11]UUO07595.1 hypothetical protein M4951_04635 [Blastopirellula sp. J2-11]
MKNAIFTRTCRDIIPCILLVASTYFGASGCNATSGPPVGVVQGRVTYEGKPVTNGDITFYSGELGSGISEALDADGNYVTQTPIRTGSYTVTILPPSQPPPEDPRQLIVRVVSKDIPAKYRDPNKSGLKFEVREGDNSFDIEMSE